MRDGLRPHIYAFGAALLAIGLMMPIQLLVVLDALRLAHSGFDRMLGHGLKSPEGFSVTHLGRIGKAPLAQTTSSDLRDAGQIR